MYLCIQGLAVAGLVAKPLNGSGAAHARKLENN